MKDSSWIVAVFLKFPKKGVALEGISCETLLEVDRAVEKWKDIAQVECICGQCPVVEKIEVIQLEIDVKTVFGKETKGPSDAWKGLIK